MVIKDYSEKKPSYAPSDVGLSVSDNGLGEDMIHYINKWQGFDDESQEIYSNNRMNYQESKKNAIPKKKSIKKEFPINKKWIAIASLIVVGAVATEHYRCAEYITNHVVESGIFSDLSKMSVRNDSQSGLIISYLDAYGNRQDMNGEYYIQRVVEDGINHGFTTDQVAIAMDHLGICDASVVEGSSLLGRIGQELLASSQQKSYDYEQSSGRRER